MRLISRLFQLILVGILTFVWANAWVIFDSRDNVVDVDIDILSSDEYVVGLVLGASVHKDGTLSPVLQQRVDAAIASYNAWHIQKLIVSGYDKDENYLEAMSMGEYLLSHSVREEHIVIDSGWYDTLASVQRVKSEFWVEKVIIFTQRYHLWRSVFLAKHNGVDAIGGVTASDDVGIDRNDFGTVREMFARVKAVGEVVFG